MYGEKEQEIKLKSLKKDVKLTIYRHMSDVYIFSSGKNCDISCPGLLLKPGLEKMYNKFVTECVQLEKYHINKVNAKVL